ncbi:hypothetical protein ACFLRC_04495 [Candidatus Altiarchaeota archaeon]
MAVFLLITSVSAQGKNVLFYEIGTQGGMTIENEYSDFAEELRNRGYVVASLTKGKLDRTKLDKYDILVMQNIQRNLDIEEISAILTFTLQEGRGVFINGVGPASNQLTIPFGVSVDDGKLIDTTDPLPEESKETYFIISRFADDETTKTLRQGIQKLGFYDGHGLKISGNAQCLAQGDYDTYSDTASFRVGDEPCIATATRFGQGLIFINSEVDILSNKYINDYSNKKLGLNIMEWLQIRVNESIEADECPIIIGELKLQVTRLSQEKDKLDGEKANLLANVNSMTGQVSSCNTDLADCEGGMIGPFTPTNWAIIIAAVLILLAAVIYTRRKAALAGEKGEGVGELEGDLGYEFGEGDEDGAVSEEVSEDDLDLKDVLDSDMLEEE